MALKNECKIVNCTNHINVPQTLSSNVNEHERDCTCKLIGVVRLRKSLLGNATRTGAKSVRVTVQEKNTISIENRPLDEYYIVREDSLPLDIETEEYESEDEIVDENNGNFPDDSAGLNIMILLTPVRPLNRETDIMFG